MAHVSEATCAIERNRVYLKWEERNADLVVVPEDWDIYVTSVQAAIDALKIRGEQEKFYNQLRTLHNHVGRWIKDHEDRIEVAVLTIREGQWLFLVMKKGCEYDRNFEDELTELDIEVANDPNFDMINLSVLALPECTEEGLSSFIDNRVRMFVYGS